MSDLIMAHTKAIKFLKNLKSIDVFNIGTGEGTSVMDVVKCFENNLNTNISIKLNLKGKMKLKNQLLPLLMQKQNLNSIQNLVFQIL